MPSASDIFLMGDWQLFKTPSTVHFIYGAYFDNRDLVTDSPVVRILLFANSYELKETLYCQLWYESSEKPTISNVTEKIILINDAENDNLGSPPYMFTCALPSTQRPIYVSLVSKPCDPSHNMLFVYKSEQSYGVKKDFLVVVKDFDSNEDKSSMIIEWLEILKRLGVSKVYFYITECHKNVVKVLEFYEQLEFVVTKFVRYPEAIVKQNHKNAMIPLHACLFENLGLYHFITPLDINELIVPTQVNDRTWQDLLKTANDKRLDQGLYELVDAFAANKVIFYTDTRSQKKFYFLKNIQRSQKFTPNGDNVKSFMMIDQVKTINHNLPQRCLVSDDCTIDNINQSDGQLSCYVDSCENLIEEDALECNQRVGRLIKDTALWKYKDDVFRGYNEAVRHVFIKNI